MKKMGLFALAALLLVFLASCNSGRFQVKDSIKSPENSLPPLQGKWVIERYVDSPYNKGTGASKDSLVNKDVLFHKDAVVVGGDYALDPNFKYKNVSIHDYLLYKYKIDPEYLDLEDKTVDIVTVVSDNQYFYEFIKYDEDKMVVFDDDRFYFLSKSVDEVSKDEVDRYINVENSIMRISNIQEADTLRSGLLMGIKTYTYDDIERLDKWSYRTIWIRSSNRTVSSIYELDKLLVPRKKGFWMVDVNRNNDYNIISDEIRATEKKKYPEEIVVDINLFGLRSAVDQRIIPNKDSIIKNILYIGNDYVSAELVDIKSNRKSLEVYPIDYLKDNKAIKISDLIGDDGLRTFVEGAQSIMKSDTTMFLNEESFGLARRNGYWIMKGRLNFESDGEEYYKDYNIKTIPPKELVSYDQLAIAWDRIKSKIPEAIDAFTSPNEDILIVVTRNSILIYPIEEDEISLKELGKIRLGASDSIVMAEWATGRYTPLWEEEVLRNYGRALD
ncbi:MAG: hypothetical protein WCZ27_00795 [Tissierellaceae bacterium]